MRWIPRGLIAVALALGVVVPGSAPAAGAATELIVNGGFATSTANWWGTGNTPISVDAGQLKAVVPGGTANKWDAMIGQKAPAFPIKQNHRYLLSFDARVSAPRTLQTTVQLNTAPYTAPLNKAFAVGTKKQRFAFAFTSSLETTQAEFTIQLGGLAGGGYTLWLDNVSLLDLHGTPAGNPVALTSGFYVDPQSNPKQWVGNNPGPKATTINNALAGKPMARWFGGWNTNLADDINLYAGAADAADKLPVLVAYNLPGRDACGGHSSGGAAGEEAYKEWIQTFAAAIGIRPALVVLEPDSIGDFHCIKETKDKEARVRMLAYALQTLKDFAPNTWTYADATNKGWAEEIGVPELAARLNSIGVANAHGLATNVSNYYGTAETVAFANDLAGRLGKPFIVDTSRNGNGASTTWCNPTGRKLGATAQPGGGAEMLLWIKVPGDSDGSCGDSTTEAGHFDPDLALKLINNP
ncbi:endoglucanase [Kribbella sandramycini]|uniref:Glucanase n=1 Tax=Kribbella sandramycini TaxID=60450 RepID=A0A7Y4KVT5_9ACTN|nr:glycoside hydrolase family 6 protein [Kribbella sandramycini]MBB6567915.1 endoglucanase [Kribbella sandramycini]NOL39490.1 endoglucanase [Kribbella sandramycini]